MSQPVKIGVPTGDSPPGGFATDDGDIIATFRMKRLGTWYRKECEGLEAPGGPSVRTRCALIPLERC